MQETETIMRCEAAVDRSIGMALCPVNTYSLRKLVHKYLSPTSIGTVLCSDDPHARSVTKCH
jgi:hypothetical protein